MFKSLDHYFALFDFYDALELARSEKFGIPIQDMAQAIVDVLEDAEVESLAREIYARVYPELDEVRD